MTNRHTNNIGQYVAAYMSKNLDDPRLQRIKAYSRSQGLKEPKVLYGEAAEQAVKDLKKENVVFSSSYTDKYHNSEVKYKKFVLPNKK